MNQDNNTLLIDPMNQSYRLTEEQIVATLSMYPQIQLFDIGNGLYYVGLNPKGKLQEKN